MDQLFDKICHALPHVYQHVGLITQACLNSINLGYVYIPVSIPLEHVAKPKRVLSYAPPIPLVTMHNPVAKLQGLTNHEWWFPTEASWYTSVLILLLRVWLKILSIIIHYNSLLWHKVKYNYCTVCKNKWVNRLVTVTIWYWKFWLLWCQILVASWATFQLFILTTLQYYWYWRIDLRPEYENVDHNVVRVGFRNLETQLSNLVQAPNHSHPKQAELRSDADAKINRFIRDCNYNVYAIQKSKQDMKLDLPGSLDLRFPIDKHHDAHVDPLPMRPFIKLLNVDYYIDWIDYLWMDVPFMMFTATPSTITGRAAEVHWTFNGNRMSMSISGGAVYEHELWDYNTAEIVANYPGISISYHLDAIRLDQHWSLILLTPFARNLSMTTIPNMTLKRKQILHSVRTFNKPDGYTDVLMMRTHAGDGQLQIAIPGDYTTITLNNDIETYLKSCAIEGRKMKAQSVFTAIVNMFGEVAARTPSQVIYTHLPLEFNDIQFDLPPLRLRVEDVNFEMATDARDGPDPPSQPVATVLTPAVMPGGVAPTESRVNDSAAVAMRIQAIANPNAKMNDTYRSYVEEFIQLILPEKLAPYDLESIRESLKRQTQIVNFDNAAPDRAAFLDNLVMTTSSFQKKEIYTKVTAPRNITTLPAEHYITFSQFTLPVANYLKAHSKFYIFGHHPDTVAEMMHKVCSGAKCVAETDFSKFDGSHTHVLYLWEEMMMLHAFPIQYHDEIKKCYTILRGALGKTRNGIKYDLLGTRASGCADTSLSNTFINAVFNYIDRRANGEDPKVALSRLGLYGGDDGISPDPYPTINERAKELNLNLKVKIRNPGEIATMLARIYVNPWVVPNHMCDPIRIVTRLHVTAELKDQAPATVLINRAVGYSVTDPFTALISNWARMIIRVHSPAELKAADPESFSYSVKQYGERGNHCFVEYEDSLPIVADSLGVPVDIIETYCEYLDSIKTKQELDDLKPLVPHDPQSTAQLVPGINVGGFLHAVDDTKRAAKLAPKAIKDYENPKPHICPSYLDEQSMMGTFERVKSVRRCVNLTGGFGYDTFWLRKAFKCNVYTMEKDPDHFAVLKRNLNGIKGSFVDFMDSSKFMIKAGDLVMIDPLWEADRKQLLYDGKDVMVKVNACTKIGATVVLRTPACYVVPDVNGYAVKRKIPVDASNLAGRSKTSTVYKLFTFRPKRK